jgi:hypothetical protein
MKMANKRSLELTKDKAERLSEGKYTIENRERVDTDTRGWLTAGQRKWGRLCHKKTELRGNANVR